MATTQEIGGIGHSVSARRTHGSSVARAPTSTTSRCPGMLYMEILRSPFAMPDWASTSRAQELDGVVAIVTGELLAQHNLAWMPTLSGDTQAVLVTDKVRYQGQEVACVIAESAYIAKDALELIDVDYEPLPAVTSPQDAKADGAPMIRDEKEGQEGNHVYHWEAGDKDATDRAFAAADKVITLDAIHVVIRRRSSAVAASPTSIRDRDRDDLHDVAGPARPPHAVRDRRRPARAQDPDHQPGHRGRLRQQGADLPRYVVATAASLLIGRPVKWVEDRTGNLISTGFARDYHMRGELAVKDGKMTRTRVAPLRPGRVLRRRAADEGEGRVVPHRDRLVRHSGRARRHRRLLHEQGARRHRVPLLVPRHRGLVPHRASRRQRRARARRGRGAVPARQLHSAGPVPVRVGDGLSTTRATTRPCESRSRSSDTSSFAPSRRPPAPKGGCSGSGSPRSRGPRRRQGEGLRHRRPAHVRLGGAPRPSHGQGDPQARRPHAGQGTRRPSPRSWPASSASRTTIEVQEGDTDNTPYGLGTYASPRPPSPGRRRR